MDNRQILPDGSEEFYMRASLLLLELAAVLIGNVTLDQQREVIHKGLATMAEMLGDEWAFWEYCRVLAARHNLRPDMPIVYPIRK